MAPVSHSAAHSSAAGTSISLKNRQTPLTSTNAYEASKRVFDVLIGVILLTLTTPIILIAALAIAIESRGSPFFIQTRLGKNGKPFRILKLRGMYKDARQRFPELYDYSGRNGLDFFFHYENDPRVTRVGRLTRRASIDELPNFWNVITGDMSLVGPRPEIPDVLDLYGPYRAEYLSVKPGITCISKCTGRDRLTKRETIELDLGYIRSRGMREDLRILWRTFSGVVLRRNVH
jgi:lipopolysaccharide/colanic/teichoic acid biosynthesis glycosyltransferase